MYKKALILDTTAFIHNFKFKDEEIFVTESVLKEIKSLKAKFISEIILCRSTIVKPSKESINVIYKICKELGHDNLSLTDIEILALAYELKNKYDVTVVSDDYTIQNVLNYIGIKFLSLATKGIKRTIKFVKFCKYCNREAKHDEKFCIICGMPLIKKSARI